VKQNKHTIPKVRKRGSWIKSLKKHRAIGPQNIMQQTDSGATETRQFFHVLTCQIWRRFRFSKV